MDIKNKIRTRLDICLRRLFPAHYRETAQCCNPNCRMIGMKSRMVHTVDGWFCNREEATAYWWDLRT